MWWKIVIIFLLLLLEINFIESIHLDASNPIIALFTTAHARCHLLEQLWKLNTKGRTDCKILYMDTDSM